MAPDGTACLSYVEPNQQTIAAFVTTTKNTAAEKTALAHVISSLQLKDSNGSLLAVTAPVLLPAVQLPAAE